MQYLIEFKLHAGAIPYFVKSTVNGVKINGKLYGISHDTSTNHLPDSIRRLSQKEFILIVKASTIFKTSYEREQYALQWLKDQKYIEIDPPAWVEPTRRISKLEHAVETVLPDDLKKHEGEINNVKSQNIDLMLATVETYESSIKGHSELKEELKKQQDELNGVKVQNIGLMLAMVEMYESSLGGIA